MEPSDEHQPRHDTRLQHGESDGGEGGTRTTGPADSTQRARTMVAGIGASAGGLEALQAFFEALPERLGVAFVVITHLSPEHRSRLAELIGARTSLPVHQVTDTLPLEPDHVYVISPDRELHVTDHEISALDFEEPRGARAPIDTFFRSFAAQYGDGFAIVLSGGGTDGSVGIKAVKEGGGLILVQDPAEAQYDSMPRSAIATGLADLVLPVRELAGRMPDLVRSKQRLREQFFEDPDRFDEEALRRILAHLRTRTGHDFSQYKRTTVLRRLARRMQVNRQERFEDYLAYLRTNAEEAQALFEDLLISVTTFFRDPEAFEALREQVVPKLFDALQEDEGREGAGLRVWVPGCATGEEAYSLAMLLLEEAERRDVHAGIQVFASDLDEGALATAREGRYPAAIEADVSEERLSRFFVREGDHYRVNRGLRDCVLFASHSLLRDPPFSRLDLVSCRNLLIYLDRELQQLVFGILHYALRPGGYVFLGTSETADGRLFLALDEEHRIFQAREHRGKEHQHLPHLLSMPRRPDPPRARRAERPSEPTLHRKALEDLAPPSILVDEDRCVVHLSETAGRYLQPPGGTLTNDITELARRELRLELQAALHRAFHENEASLSPPVSVRFDETPRHVQLLVRPRRGHEDQERHALVVFVEGGPVEEGEAAGSATTDETGRRLNEELRQTREQLQRTRENAEATAEELRASNEELQSINEEYRSTTEELETGKEELQSVNEELETVNNELTKKLDEVSRAHNDVHNLMTAAEVGTLFLDPKLQIKRFTPPAAALFNITESDRGRPLTDFTHRLDYPALEADARAVLRDLAPIEREVRSRDNRWYSVRMKPYRTAENRIDGVVVTLIDFTTRSEAEEALRQSEERYRLIVDTVKEYAIFMLDTEGRITTWNPGAKRVFGYTDDEIIGRPSSIVFTEEDRAAGVPEKELETAIRDGQALDDRWHVRKDGSRFWVNGVMTALYHPNGGLRGFAKIMRDNTDKKEAEDQLRRLNETLEQRVAERTEQLRALASTLAIAEQEERRRVSQILHDDLQQLLFGIQLRLDAVAEAIEHGEAREHDAAVEQAALADDVREANDWLAEAITMTRRLTVDLSPPVLKDEGLTDALRWLVTQMGEVHGLRIDLRADDAYYVRNEGLRVLLFQIVRELLFNVVKHAETDRATVELERADHHIRITVADEGRGFDVSAASVNNASFGLSNARERLSLIGGQMEIDTAPDAGTTVTVLAPTRHPNAAA